MAGGEACGARISPLEITMVGGCSSSRVGGCDLRSSSAGSIGGSLQLQKTAAT